MILQVYIYPRFNGDFISILLFSNLNICPGMIFPFFLVLFLIIWNRYTVTIKKGLIGNKKDA